MGNGGLERAAESVTARNVVFAEKVEHINLTLQDGSVHIPSLLATLSSTDEGRAPGETPTQRDVATSTESRKPEFWARVKGGAYLHRADPTSDRYRPEVAFVFVHGLNSSPKCWLKRARERMEGSPVDVDALVFRYPAGIFADADNGRIARQLREAVRNFFPMRAPIGGAPLRKAGEPCPTGYHHVVYFTHSNGGIVVKHAICDHLSVLDRATSLTADQMRQSAEELLRTRVVVNFDVPHGGTTPKLTSRAVKPYTRVNRFVVPILSLSWWIWKKRFGMNWIPWQLRHGSGQLRAMERTLDRGRKLFESQILPFPVIEEIVAAQSAVVAKVTDPMVTRSVVEIPAHLRAGVKAYRVTQLLGSHGGVLDGKLPHDLAPRRQLDWLQRYSDITSHIICERYIGLNIQRDQQLRVDAMTGSQSGILQQLHELLSQTNTSHHLIATGEAGVGKSRMLARLTRALSVQFLEDRFPFHRPLPILVQLKDLPVQWPNQAAFDDFRGAIPPVLSAILAAWRDYVNKQCGRPGLVTSEWLHKTIRQSSTIILIDDLDDFLSMRPDIKWDDLRESLEFLHNRVSRIDQVQSVVLGARSGQFWLPSFQDQGWLLYHIHQMARAEVVELFPALEPALHICENDKLGEHGGAGDLLRTPLVAFALGDHQHSLGPEDLTVGRILEVAVRALVKRTRTMAAQQVPADDAMNVLTLVGIIFYGSIDPLQLRSADQLTIPQVQTAAVDLERSWSDHVEHWVRHPLNRAFRLLKDRRVIESLLTAVCRTVPSKYGDAEPNWSTTHFYIRDFLCGRYLAELARSRHARQFGQFGYMPQMHSIAADLVGAWTVSESLARDATSFSKENRELYTVCNLIALFARNSRSTMEAGAFSAMLSAITGDFVPWARCFVMNGFMVRFLSPFLTGSPDPLLKPLKSTICVAAEMGDIVTQSQAHAYLEILESGTNASSPKLPISGRLQEVVAATTIGWDDPLLLKRRALQLANIELVNLFLRNPPHNFNLRMVPSVHYLLFLAAAYATGRWIDETNALLVNVFAPNSKFRDCVKNPAEHGITIRPVQAVEVFDAAERLFKMGPSGWR